MVEQPAGGRDEDGHTLPEALLLMVSVLPPDEEARNQPDEALAQARCNVVHLRACSCQCGGASAHTSDAVGMANLADLADSRSS